MPSTRLATCHSKRISFRACGNFDGDYDLIGQLDRVARAVDLR
ncbi:MAG: hypothetical protein VB035_09450 [Candidatus Fimivivens sp.]|nr:hypothetical protein [Candidatus Fimivivens sp.]